VGQRLSEQNVRIAVIIPAFNEAASIAETIADAASLALDQELVVVNDGSRDATSSIARATGRATVLDLPVNLGIGGAVQTGFRYAARAGHDIVVQFDGDGQHVAAEIERLIAPIRAQQADVVIGSRFVERGSSPGAFRSTRSRRLGIRLLALANWLLAGRWVRDSTSGFRAYNREAVAFLADRYPADYPEPEALVLLGRNGFRLVEVPVVMRERQGGRSSIAGLRSAHYMIKVLLAMLMTALRPAVRR
jgi:glycosyltransferase involved in cell wall biosynthesis